MPSALVRVALPVIASRGCEWAGSGTGPDAVERHGDMLFGGCARRGALVLELEMKDMNRPDMMDLSTDEALQRVLELARELPAERLALTQASGRVLAEDILATQDAPVFDNSARDGYAIRRQDLDDPSFDDLEVIEIIHAGQIPKRELGPGQAARIMTGAMVPAGADTIIMREDAREEGGRVTIARPEPRGAWVRRRGSFVSAGERLLARGTELGGAELGVLASMGRAIVNVYRRPVVAVICAGDELVEVGQPLGEGQIYNANAYMLQGLIEQAGARAVVFPVLLDDPEAIERTYDQALGCADVIVSSGGVSVGERDHVREVLDALVGGMLFWRIKMKPGKPLAVGQHADTGKVLLGLPGNPASSFVCFHKFVKPLLRAMMADHRLPMVTKLVTTAAIPSTPKRRHYVTGRVTHVDGALTFAPIANQDPGNPAILCQPDALGVIELGVGRVDAGDLIEVELLGVSRA